ncbi:MAG: hypothetical protein JRH20_24090 [Deltaproteobacteria bacterium]|nr:hypothetical protein [Deltaproteobacteria bacterium]
MQRSQLLSCLLLATLFAHGCAETKPSVVDDTSATEDGGTACVEGADEDQDGIPNGVEGCKEGVDSDRDGSEDWRDFDSDNDGIADVLEAGEKGGCLGPSPETWPCDTDGDDTPDYRDLDSDGDGLPDEDEDTNGDGLVGCCIETCGQPDSKNQQADCTLGADGCGPGQTCEGSRCSPAIAFLCSDGETSPRLTETFDDGINDLHRGSFICRDATEDKPQGRKPVTLVRSSDPSHDPTSGDWHLALEQNATLSVLALDDPANKEAAALMDHGAADTEVAGFVVSFAPTETDMHLELQAAIERIQLGLAAEGKVFLRSSGLGAKTHDKYDTLQGVTLDVELDAPTDISTFRHTLVAKLLGREATTLGSTPNVYGSSHARLILRFALVRRFGFVRDASAALVLNAEGNPTEDNTKTEEQRVLIIGAIAGRDNYDDSARPTGFIVDDLAGGSALAIFSDRVENECDVGLSGGTAKADIIWVMDESQSMDNVRASVVKNAATFFDKARKSGLDFRIAVTGVNDPMGDYRRAAGRFCSEDLADVHAYNGQDDDTDRFLTSSEKDLFEACVRNPPGYEGGGEYGLVNAKEAVALHQKTSLPMERRIRDDAEVVVIIATDEPDQTVIDETSIPNTTKGCAFGPSLTEEIEDVVLPFINFFKTAGTNGQKVSAHLIGFVCASRYTCPDGGVGKGVAHGYQELIRALGGQMSDVCQHDMGESMDAIIDSIIGEASPVKLERVPIAASIAVAVDGKTLSRSRDKGFDYRPATNTLAFIDTPVAQGTDVVVSYKRWNRQVSIK